MISILSLYFLLHKHLEILVIGNFDSEEATLKLYLESAPAVLLMAFLIMMPGPVSAQTDSQAEQVPASPAEAPPVLPRLADIIPLATELTVRLATLESKMKDQPDLPSFEKRYAEIRAKLDDFAAQFQQLKGSEDYKQNRFVDLGVAIKQEAVSFEAARKPIKEAILQFGEFRKEWLAEKTQWDEWRGALSQEKELEQLGSTFQKADETIIKALNIVLPRLEVMFTMQQKGAEIDARLKILGNELAGFIGQRGRVEVAEGIPPMLSPRFFLQFLSSEFWDTVQDRLNDASWPFGRFLANQGWILLIQVLISVLVIIAIHKKRTVLEKSERWRFLGERMFSAGLALGYMATMFIYANQGTPAIFQQVLSIIGLIAFTRILVCLIEASWKKELVYGLMIVLVVDNLLEMYSLPLPFFRLYTLITALAALLFCSRWARQSARQDEPGIHPWGLRLAAVFFGIVAIMELWGNGSRPFLLLSALMRSAATVLFFVLYMYIIRGGLEGLFRIASVKQAFSFYPDTDTLVRRVGLFVDIAIWGLVLVPAVFVIWGVFDNIKSAASGLLGLGFNLGENRITTGLLIVAVGFVYGSFLLSWMIQNLLLDKVLLTRSVERGVRASIKRLVHYVLISLGLLFAISILGLELTKLTIIVSALGVGIGFGLQNVVSNFVSGLILLFERPVRVGDCIEVNGNWCEVQKVGLRATTVKTFDGADMIIPNADLVTNQVTNWTLKNRKVRIIIPVGVAYGSDIPRVIETLKASTEAHSMVAKYPAPQILFLRFGESSLDFELRVWITDIDQMLTAKSDLHQEIDRRFREAKIEIAFPQRDLHVRGVDQSIRPVSSVAVKEA